jgi:hypothetical protein
VLTGSLHGGDLLRIDVPKVGGILCTCLSKLDLELLGLERPKVQGRGALVSMVARRKGCLQQAVWTCDQHKAVSMRLSSVSMRVHSVSMRDRVQHEDVCVRAQGQHIGDRSAP